MNRTSLLFCYKALSQSGLLPESGGFFVFWFLVFWGFFAIVRTKPTEEVKNFFLWVGFLLLWSVASILEFSVICLAPELCPNNLKSFNRCFQKIMWFKHCLALIGKWITGSGFKAGIWIVIQFHVIVYMLLIITKNNWK